MLSFFLGFLFGGLFSIFTFLLLFLKLLKVIDRNPKVGELVIGLLQQLRGNVPKAPTTQSTSPTEKKIPVASSISSPVLRDEKKPTSERELKTEGRTETVLEGWVQLKEAVVWTKYWVVLRSDKWLTIFKNERLSECNGYIDLSGCLVNRKGKENIFIIFHPDEKTIYKTEKKISESNSEVVKLRLIGSAHKCIFKVSSPKELDDWVSSVTNLTNEISVSSTESLKFSPTFTPANSSSASELSQPHPMIEKREAKVFDAETLNAMRAELADIEIPPPDGAETTEEMLSRFLCARGGDPKKAAALLRSCAQWKQDYKPEEISIESILPEIHKHKVFVHGHDKHFHPCLILIANRHNQANSSADMVLKMAVYVLEQTIKVMPPGISKLVVVCDCSGFSLSANMDTTLAKAAAEVLQNYFPERLAATYMVNIPMVVNVAWNALKPFLDRDTTEKFQFIRDLKKLQDFFDVEQLPEFLGGTSPFPVPSPNDPSESSGLETYTTSLANYRK